MIGVVQLYPLDWKQDDDTAGSFKNQQKKGLLDLVSVFLNWGILNSKYNCKEPE